MKYLFLVIFTIFLSTLCSKQYRYSAKKYIPFHINQHQYSSDSYALYRAVITGNKKNLPKINKDQFKDYGLLHLLTPSGIHLSSLFFINYLPTIFIISILLFLFLYIQTFQSYLSLERVILFKGLLHISHFSKRTFSTEKIFFLVILLSIIIGNYNKSPLSFLYSVLFWGTIIIFKDNRLKMILFLNISLHLAGILFNQPPILSSVMINPLYTSLLVFIFPLILLNYLLQGVVLLDYLINNYLDFFLNSLFLIHSLDLTIKVSFYWPVLLFAIICALKNKYYSMCLILCFNISQISSDRHFKSKEKLILNLEDVTQIEDQRKETIYFDSKKCRMMAWKILCKKKPSTWEGLYTKY